MFIKELFNGISCYFKANRVISKYKMWPYFFLPGILSFGYIILLIVLGSLYLTDFSTFINENFIPGFMQGGFMEAVVAVFLWILLLLIGFITYKEIVLILFSPVLGYLSERVEKLIYDQDPPHFNFKNLATDIIRGLTLSLRNFVYMLSLTIIAWFVAFIPVIGTTVSPVLILLVQSYYGGAGLADLTLERKKFSVKESIKFARDNRSRITGVGAGFILMLMIPILGWFAAPGFGTVAATIATLEKINKNDKNLLEL